MQFGENLFPNEWVQSRPLCTCQHDFGRSIEIVPAAGFYFFLYQWRRPLRSRKSPSSVCATAFVLYKHFWVYAQCAHTCGGTSRAALKNGDAFSLTSSN
jgi:hypothetical protein